MLNADAKEIFEHLQPWLSVILTAFGPARVMFGSDWPVCTVGISDSWEKWRSIVESTCKWAAWSPEQEQMVWSGTAIRAYGIGEVV
jgi:L-rhamnono-1,4-lactonase